MDKYIEFYFTVDDRITLCLLTMFCFQAICRLIPPSSGLDFSRSSLDLVLKASKSHCDVTLDFLKKGLDDSLMETRRILVRFFGLGVVSIVIILAFFI